MREIDRIKHFNSIAVAGTDHRCCRNHRTINRKTGSFIKWGGEECRCNMAAVVFNLFNLMNEFSRS
jgi:DNA gyrase inhibitor GyrI